MAQLETQPTEIKLDVSTISDFSDKFKGKSTFLIESIERELAERAVNPSDIETVKTVAPLPETQAKIILAIVGSRTYTDYSKMCEELNKLYPIPEKKIACIVSGGAQGADSLAKRWADDNGISIKVLLPQWKRRDGSNNKMAGKDRNTDIIDACDVVCAFWCGKSRGTLDTIEKAKAKGKVVHVFTFN